MPMLVVIFILKINNMKKNLLSTALISFSFFASAQVIQKGDKLFGGSFSFSAFNTNPTGPQSAVYSNAGILPSFAIAVKNNLTFGVRGNINYSRNRMENNSSDKTVQTNLSLGLGLFLKKYRLLQNRFGVYFDNEIGGRLDFQKGKFNNSPDYQKYTTWGANYTFSPGVFYKFSDRFLGEANIGGVSVSYYKPYDSGSHFGAGVSFLQYFNLGINYRISKNKSTVN